tara:strand:+ start:1243 stop:1467 length:225 start_codon:yes stop_codon:yes gene_type:complete
MGISTGISKGCGLAFLGLCEDTARLGKVDRSWLQSFKYNYIYNSSAATHFNILLTLEDRGVKKKKTKWLLILKS